MISRGSSDSEVWATMRWKSRYVNVEVEVEVPRLGADTSTCSTGTHITNSNSNSKGEERSSGKDLETKRWFGGTRLRAYVCM